MSIVPKETIEVIAQSIGITNLSSDVALAVAPDVEYRMREIMQVHTSQLPHSLVFFHLHLQQQSRAFNCSLIFTKFFF